MPHFLLKLVAPRPSFAMDLNDNEKKMMQEHFLYWKEHQQRGAVLVFGPVLDLALTAWARSTQPIKRPPAPLRPAIPS
jgi:hypothetical protein